MDNRSSEINFSILVHSLISLMALCMGESERVEEEHEYQKMLFSRSLTAVLDLSHFRQRGRRPGPSSPVRPPVANDFLHSVLSSPMPIVTILYLPLHRLPAYLVIHIDSMIVDGSWLSSPPDGRRCYPRFVGSMVAHKMH